MKILVINGVNLNMLGIREPNLYGKQDYNYLVKTVKNYAKEKGVKVKVYQSNYEGDICTKIQKSLNKVDAFILNAGAFTHTSVAILDALKSVNIPTVEVHITDINNREEFRKLSYVSMFAQKVIAGFGIDGYKMAIDYLIEKYNK